MGYGIESVWRQEAMVSDKVVQQRARRGGKNIETIHLLQQRVTELEARLRALVGDENRTCMYCGKAARLHSDDCPIVAGRKALGEGE